MNHGVYVSQQATSISTPVVAESGVPFVVGLAPVQAADKPAAPGTPVLCTSWAEAVEKLENENPLTNLMAGIIKLHVYMTPPSPAQEIDFVLEYDASYVTSALQG